MRKFMLLAVAAIAGMGAVFATPAAAGEAPQAPETRRIGVVLIQQVFKSYNYAKDTEERIKAAFQPEQQHIEEMIREIQELERSLQNNPLKPPGSQLWRKEMMTIETKKVDIQAMQEDFGRRVRNEEAAFWMNMYNAFQRACKVIGDYYQYDIIIAAPDPILSEEAIKAQDPMAIQQEILMRRIQYINDRANLTKTIIDLLNQNYQKHLQDPQKNPL